MNKLLKLHEYLIKRVNIYLEPREQLFLNLVNI
jgi:hypothetical protein